MYLNRKAKRKKNLRKKPIEMSRDLGNILDRTGKKH